jgi:CubicO group peptidase (beta-lactamase class C family)
MTNATNLVPLLPHPAGLAWPRETWPKGQLDVRVDRGALEKHLDHAFALPEPEDLDRTHAVVVVQRGEIVAERYAHDVEPDDTFLSWSMAKSIVCSLVGILVRQGKVDIMAPMPVREWPQGDPRRKITIKQMLRMVDGLRFREAEDLGDGGIRYYAPDESDVIPMLFGEGRPDVAAFAATLPKVHEPEIHWNYNSGGSNLLSRLVSDTVGGGEAGMREFMNRELFDPIGMTTADPRFDEVGTFVGSSHFFASARDYARFGYLWLRNGVWDGQRILPEGWVDFCRTPSAQAPNGIYGAHFWTIPGSLGTFECHGAAGQRITICPKLDLVIVRVGKTEPHKVGAVVRYNKSLVDMFRPTAV